MSIADRYQAYAEAFEVTYEDDDWTRIEPFFTEDAVYEAAPEEDARGLVDETQADSVLPVPIEDGLRRWHSLLDCRLAQNSTHANR